jgi:hypothetical protein
MVLISVLSGTQIMVHKLYSNKLSFNAHRHNVHGTVRNSIICRGRNGDTCGHGFPSRDSLAKHVENDHQVVQWPTRSPMVQKVAGSNPIVDTDFCISPPRASLHVGACCPAKVTVKYDKNKQL